MDKIEIRDLEIFANHGVFPEETALGQKFVVSAVMYTETRPAGLTDDLSASINYGEVSHMITDFLQKNTYKLLEALAENLCQMLLQELPLLKMITLRVEKPWAPVMLPLDTVSVCISRGWNTAYLSIGSNLGEKKDNLLQAIRLLNEDPLTKVTKQSSFIETEPVGYTEQDDFLNAALEIKTLRTPEELLELIHTIEQELKRVRKIHWGPRTIDLDIILFNDQIIQKDDLIIPHIEMTNRLFVLEPLCEIAPYVIHPVLHESVLALKQKLL